MAFFEYEVEGLFFKIELNGFFFKIKLKRSFSTWNWKAFFEIKLNGYFSKWNWTAFFNMKFEGFLLTVNAWVKGGILNDFWGWFFQIAYGDTSGHWQYAHTKNYASSAHPINCSQIYSIIRT